MAERIVLRVAQDLESDSPWHTCIAGTQCRIASEADTRSHRPGRLPEQCHREDLMLHQLRHRYLHRQRQRQSPHLKLLLTTFRLPPRRQEFYWQPHQVAFQSAAQPTACMHCHQIGIPQKTFPAPVTPCRLALSESWRRRRALLQLRITQNFVPSSFCPVLLYWARGGAFGSTCIQPPGQFLTYG